jgi:DNA polymerase-4
MGRAILHADMDAFFASVHQLLYPRHRGLPVIVGSLSRRSVVSAASYEARAFGVCSGMPMFKARQLCPQGVFVPVPGAACHDLSQQALQVYLRYTPLVDPISIDEAALDLTGCQKLFGEARQVAREIQQTIAHDLGLSVSIGLGPNRLVAKIASNWHKPGGLTEILPEQLPAILAPLPVKSLWGIGPVTAQRLALHGVTTLGQLQALPADLCEWEFGSLGGVLQKAAAGLDDTPVERYTGRRDYRQMSEEVTLAHDTRDLKQLSLTLLRLCDSLTRRLRNEGYEARTVTLKLRLADFQLISRARTLPRLTAAEKDLYSAAEILLQGFPLGMRQVRLIGVSFSGLKRGRSSPQLSLFADHEIDRLRRLGQARDSIFQRFGDRAIIRASLLTDSPSEASQGL